LEPLADRAGKSSRPNFEPITTAIRRTGDIFKGAE